MPACASCNINKHAMKLEDFRQLVAGFMKHLNERNTQYKIAKRYGLVIEQQKPVVFYFEQHTKEAVVITIEDRQLPIFGLVPNEPVQG